MNPAVISKLFHRTVTDYFFESVIIENKRPYATTMPNLGPSSGTPKITKLPRTLDGAKEKPYVRAAQDKEAHRAQMIMIAVGADHKWPLIAALQSAQGGFMSKSVGTKLTDRDRLQVANPVVYAHGTSSIGGQMNFGHIVPTEAVDHILEIPVIRTDSTEQQRYHLQDENSLHEWKELSRQRKPYSTAKRTKNLTTLEAELRRLERTGEADEVATFTKTGNSKTIKLGHAPNRAETGRWIDEKVESYKDLLVRSGFANVELRQALPGYEAVPAGTRWKQDIQGWNLPDDIAGLVILSFNLRQPILGGHVAVGCGFHPRRVYRVSTADGGETPEFDCLLKIEPFKALAICMDDATGSDWNEMDQKWHPITPNAKLPDCKVSRAITAWHACDKTKFDFNFVPGPVATDEDDDIEE